VGHARTFFFHSFTSPVHTTVNSAFGVQDSVATITIGNEAVMVFFVLSGFLVGGSVLRQTRTGKWHWRDYALKRLTRLWIVLIPAIFIGMLLDVTGSWLLSSAGSVYSVNGFPNYSGTVHIIDAYSVKIILANIFFACGILARHPGSNVALWSLTCEFWYYLLFPLLLITFLPQQKLWKRSVYLAIAVLIFCFIGTKYSLLFWIWILGALLTSIPLKLPARIASLGSAFFGVALILAFPLVKIYVKPVHIGQSIMALLTAILIYCLMHNSAAGKKNLYAILAKFFAKFSYTLYLTHLPLLMFLSALLFHPWQPLSTSPVNVAIFVGTCAVTATASYCIYLLFEANTDELRSRITQMVNKRSRQRTYQEFPQQCTEQER
jgi:peptidoglycan/LPS O-acetylase OafA/YrhL